MRKDWKVSLIGLLLLVLILICVCNTEKADAKGYDFMETIRGTIGTSCEELRDKETGVHYFKGNNGGICPKYNADGTLYVD